MTDDDTPRIEVHDDHDGHRYVVTVDGEQAGFAVYHLRGGHHVFVHTEIDDRFEGKGVGSELARSALSDVRAKGGSVVPLCPFIAGYIERHPEYEDLVDREALAALDRPRH